MQKFETKRIAIDDLPAIYCRLGFAYYIIKNFEKTIEYCHKSLDFESTKHLEYIYESMGHAYVELKKWVEAEGSFRKYLEQVGRDYKARIQLANALYNQDKYKETIEILETLDDSDDLSVTEKADVIYRLGSAFYALQQYEKSYLYYEMYKQLVPKDWRGYRALAEIYILQGEKDEAISAINSSISLGYADPEVFELLAELSGKQE